MIADMRPERSKMSQWETKDSAPKDGTHILVCFGFYSEQRTFAQSPPMVVHYWGNPGEEGFYLSTGIVQDSYNDKPVVFTHWRALGDEPRG